MNNDLPKRVLVTRFSSLGDVALTIPVIKIFLKENPNVEVIYVSRLFVSSLFQNIDRLVFKPIDLDHKHKGVLGILTFFIALKNENIIAYADLHNVLRTKILQFLFRLKGVSVVGLNKGRKEKKLLVKKSNKQKVQLKTTLERYADVFRSLGFNLSEIDKEPHPIRKESKIIGIAPFAQFKSKIYPIEKLKEIANYFINKGYQIILFGGGSIEKQILNNWAKENANVSVANTNSLISEIEIMKKLAFVIAMDSANMHLASLAQTPVFSIWGGTHVYGGFLGHKQNSGFVVEDKELACRPCSVFGTNNCYRQDFACMQNIKLENITKIIESNLK